MEDRFSAYCMDIFCLPEIESITVRDIIIRREDLEGSVRRAVDASYHDSYSDIDLSVQVCLPPDGSIRPEDYIKRIDRFGVTEDTALGWAFIAENLMYRIIFKDGMRYDLGFSFKYDNSTEICLDENTDPEKDNSNWPKENIYRFWFIQIQALGKLYRRDYLISSHLANMNCNDTLVMQMVLRDIEYGTNHHRYGYSELLEYTNDLGKLPYEAPDGTFYRIADHLYAAALTYDRLARSFYPEYEARCNDFFAIWDLYEMAREEKGADLYDL